jgi:hypothetical protein
LTSRGTRTPERDEIGRVVVGAEMFLDFGPVFPGWPPPDYGDPPNADPRVSSSPPTMPRMPAAMAATPRAAARGRHDPARTRLAAS